MGARRFGIVALVLVVAASACGAELPWPQRRDDLLPAVWQAIPPKERLAAKRVAEVDADRLLTERIYGLRINAETLVLDLALASDDVRSALENHIKGIRTKEVRYSDDLIVRVVRAVTVRDVIETIIRTLRKTKTILGIKTEEIENITTYTRDTEVVAIGNGAPRKTKGYTMILAKRAAELDAYRKLAEIVTGIQINSQTSVRDLAVASDLIRTHLAPSLMGARTVRVTYSDDCSCEVTMELTIRETIETLRSSYKRYGGKLGITEKDWKSLERSYRDKVVTVTGSGAPPEPGAEPPVAPVAEQPFYEEKLVIERVIKREVGVIK